MNKCAYCLAVGETNKDGVCLPCEKYLKEGKAYKRFLDQSEARGRGPSYEE